MATTVPHASTLRHHNNHHSHNRSSWTPIFSSSKTSAYTFKTTLLIYFPSTTTTTATYHTSFRTLISPFKTLISRFKTLSHSKAPFSTRMLSLISPPPHSRAPPLPSNCIIPVHLHPSIQTRRRTLTIPRRNNNNGRA